MSLSRPPKLCALQASQNLESLSTGQCSILPAEVPLPLQIASSAPDAPPACPPPPGGRAVQATTRLLCSRLLVDLAGREPHRGVEGKRDVAESTHFPWMLVGKVPSSRLGPQLKATVAWPSSPACSDSPLPLCLRPAADNPRTTAVPRLVLHPRGFLPSHSCQ